MTLDQLKVGQDAILRTIGGEGELRHHLLDMGLTPGTEVTLRKVAPMGDPIELELRGYELTLRLADAAKIEVDHVHETDRAAGVVLLQCAIAWVIAFLVHTVGTLLGFV